MNEYPPMNSEKENSFAKLIANSLLLKPVIHDDMTTYTDMDTGELSLNNINKVSAAVADALDYSFASHSSSSRYNESFQNMRCKTMMPPDYPAKKGYVESHMCELGPKEKPPRKKRKKKEGAKNYDEIKRLRQSGQSYVNRKGKHVPPAKFVYKLCKCHMKCKDTLSESKRLEIFEYFWKLGSWDAQSNFIAQSVREVPIKRKCSKSLKRTVTRQYSFDHIRVCQAVFTSTLGINHMRVDYCLRKSKLRVCSPDERGKHNSKKKNIINNSYDSIKLLRQSGQSYVNRKGKHVPSAKFIFKICKCHVKCKDKLSEPKRREIFEHFWKLGSWNAQSNFIAQSVVEVPVKRKYTKSLTLKRKVTRQYSLNGVRVCQAVFTSTLGINHMRVDYCLKRKFKLRVCSSDERGKHNPKKNSEKTLSYIREFLKRFPKYHSPYSMVKKQYFSPTLSKRKIHGLYVQEMKTQNKKYVSYSTFNNMCKEYNIDIYIPKKNTCQLCDRLNIQILNDPSETMKEELRCHQMRAQYAQEKLQQTTIASKQCPGLLSFSFNLEKTQPLPYLNTSEAYYKRQLWLYNFGIHTLNNSQGYMCIWVENEGKRGSREICSCILEFLRSQDMSRLKKLSSFSDSCGGQNRNENVIAFMMYICQICNVEWEHTYLESGHSFLPVDADFAIIEKKKQKVSSIFSVNEWIDLIESAKPKNSFKIIRMNEKILDFDQVNNEFTFRSVNIDNEPFSWLQVKYLRVIGNSKIMEYKTTNDPMAPLFKIDFSKCDEKPLYSIILKSAYPKGVAINKAKYDDLQSLLPYVPPPLHQFYRNLPHDCKSENDSSVLPDIRDQTHDELSIYQ